MLVLLGDQDADAPCASLELDGEAETGEATPGDDDVVSTLGSHARDLTETFVHGDHLTRDVCASSEKRKPAMAATLPRPPW